jgi:hypothetical protein
MKPMKLRSFWFPYFIILSEIQGNTLLFKIMFPLYDYDKLCDVQLAFIMEYALLS